MSLLPSFELGWVFLSLLFLYILFGPRVPCEAGEKNPFFETGHLLGDKSVYYHLRIHSKKNLHTLLRTCSPSFTHVC